MGAIEIAAILVSLVLVLLIFLAFKLKGNQNKQPHRAAPSFEPEPAPVHPPLADKVEPPVIEPEIQQTAPAEIPTQPTETQSVIAEPVVTVCNSPISSIPQDSILRRHYLANQSAEIADTEPCASQQIQPPASAAIPQDSVLKRHFIAKLEAQIMAELPERPCDSILRRHYQSILAHELQKRLAEFV